MNVDLSSIEQAFVALAATAITTIGSWGLVYLAKKWKVDLNAAQVAGFDDALAKSITTGAQAAEAEIKAKGWDHVDVHNTILGFALNSIVSKFPDALKGVGLSSNLGDAGNAAAISAALKRALPAALATAAASPATPPASTATPSTITQAASVLLDAQTALSAVGMSAAAPKSPAPPVANPSAAAIAGAPMTAT